MSEASLRSSPIRCVIEPFVRLGDQTRVWSLGFYVLIALIAGCGVLLWRSPARRRRRRPRPDAADAPPTWRDAASWVALAAVPSGLLVAVTAHISTDVAAVPLLWVLPLALYLLTFVIVFARRPIIPHWLVVAVQPIFVIGAGRRAHLRSAQDDPRADRDSSRACSSSARWCAMASWRARRPAPRYLTALLPVDVGRRHDRRHRGRADRAARLQLGGRISDPDRACGAVPARASRCRANRVGASLLFGALAAAALVLIVSTLNSIVLSRDGLQLDRRRAPDRERAVLARTAAVRRDDRVRASRQPRHCRAGRAPCRCAASSASPRSSETADGQFRVLQHGTTLHGAQRIRDDNGEPARRPPGTAAVLLRRLRHRAGASTRCARASAARSASR